MFFSLVKALSTVSALEHSHSGVRVKLGKFPVTLMFKVSRSKKTRNISPSRYKADDVQELMN